MEKYQFAQTLSGRFISEFGMEAYPHLETTLSVVTKPDQQHPGSVTMDFHNKAIGQERRLVSYVAENFGVKYDLASFTHLSQMVQAEAMEYAYKTWRREWGQAGARKCGGVLVWQLNDCWPTTSWAVVVSLMILSFSFLCTHTDSVQDYYRVKKPGFYSIAKALKPLALGVSRTCRDWSKTYMNPWLDLGHVDPTLDAREDTKYQVWVASSAAKLVEGQINVRFISIQTGKDVLNPVTMDIMVHPNATTEVLSESIAPLKSELRDTTKPFQLADYDPYVIHGSFRVDGQVISVDTAWPQPYKYLNFAERGLTFKVSAAGQITIGAKKPLKGLVFEETRAIRLSGNNFDLVPGEEVRVKFSGVSLAELRFTYVGAPAASLEISGVE
jgi:beta-mannosidase